MLKNFPFSLEYTLLEECGKNGLKDGAPHDDPRDPGGFTIWGLSKRAHPWVSIKTTKTEAADTYEKVYWRPIGCDQLPTGVDLCAFDFAVNAGVGTVMRKLRTLKKAGALSLDALYAQRVAFYNALAERKPELGKAFLKGWLSRASRCYQLALKLQQEEHEHSDSGVDSVQGQDEGARSGTDQAG